MPQEVQKSIQRALHGFDRSLQLYQETLDELTEAGRITPEEARQRLRRYQETLARETGLLEEGTDRPRIDPTWRRDLKAMVKTIEWRLRLYGEDTSIDKSFHAISSYLKRQNQAMQEAVNQSIEEARRLFRETGPLVRKPDRLIHINALNQITHERVSLRVPCWRLGEDPLHYRNELVDRIRRQTGCQATIFQRIPQGFLRIATNIETLEGKRAVGTFIPNDSTVIRTILRGETYRGSAFVLNNWYASVYEPIYLDGRIEGILYVGRKEELQLVSGQQLSGEKMKFMLDKVFDWHYLNDQHGNTSVEKLIEFFTKPQQHTVSNPLVELGLKELTVLLMQEKERRKTTNQDDLNEEHLDLIVEYIREHLAEEISAEALARLACMSQASFYRYFKEKFQTTPVEFINRERLREAHRLLEENPKLNIQEICQAVGFQSCSYFIKLFRQHYGLTPKQYQLKRREADHRPAAKTASQHLG